MGRIPRPVHTVNTSASPRERRWGRGVPGWVWEAVSGGLGVSRVGGGLRDATRRGGLWRPPAASHGCDAMSRECGRRRRWCAHPVSTDSDGQLASHVSRRSVCHRTGQRHIDGRRARGMQLGQRRARASVGCSPTASVAHRGEVVRLIAQETHGVVGEAESHERVEGAGVLDQCAVKLTAIVETDLTDR